MIVCEDIDCIRAFIKSQKDKAAGLVPTMGYLHEGHMSLVDKAKELSDVVIVSIFVNPKQFGPNEDFNRYPRDLEKDKNLLISRGVDVLFVPSLGVMYDKDFSSKVIIEGISNILEGAFRPGHFDGVCTVVSKLFNIVKPQRAFFGEKDYQQLKIIQKMVKDLNFDIEIIPVPIKREQDGLAMSSRNVYLDDISRHRASSIYSSLLKAKKQFENGLTCVKTLTNIVKNNLDVDSIDYIKIVDKDTLEEKTTASKYDRILIAVRISGVRFIDNIEL